MCNKKIQKVCIKKHLYYFWKLWQSILVSVKGPNAYYRARLFIPLSLVGIKYLLRNEGRMLELWAFSSQLLKCKLDHLIVLLCLLLHSWVTYTNMQVNYSWYFITIICVTKKFISNRLKFDLMKMIDKYLRLQIQVVRQGELFALETY